MNIDIKHIAKLARLRIEDDQLDIFLVNFACAFDELHIAHRHTFYGGPFIEALHAHLIERHTRVGVVLADIQRLKLSAEDAAERIGPCVFTVNFDVFCTDDLSQFGLSDTKRYISLTDTEGNTRTYWLGTQTDEGQYIQPEDETDAVYLSPAGVDGTLSMGIYDMARLPKLPQLTADNVSALTVTAADGKSLSLTASESQYTLHSNTVLTLSRYFSVAYCSPRRGV